MVWGGDSVKATVGEGKRLQTQEGLRLGDSAVPREGGQSDILTGVPLYFLRVRKYNMKVTI